MKLTVIIPSYNGCDLLAQSLPLVYASIRFAKLRDYEIIIVDNGSSDNTRSSIKTYNHIQYQSFSNPLGFTKATNIGIKKAKGEYILLLNNDCLVQKNTINQLIQFLDNQKDIFFTQPIIMESGQEVIGYKVDLTIAKAFTVDKETSLSVFINQQNLSSIFDNNNHNNIYGLSATCLMAKKEAFARIGFFDESFGSYLEDIDWCFRAVKKGVNFSPSLDTSVNHLHLQTSQKMGTYKARHDFANWIRIICKHYPKKYIYIHFPTIFIERLRNLSGIFKNR